MYTCQYCGKQFNDKVRLCPKEYCSISCRNKARAKPGKWAKFTCKWCGKEFWEWAYRKPTICSDQCRSEYGAHQPKPAQRRPNNFIERTCLVCGQKFKIHKCYINRPNFPNQGKYCSKKCRGIAVGKNMRGAKNINYNGGRQKFYRGKNWQEQAKKARERDCYTCQKCGTSPALDVHHIIPYKDFGNNYEAANQLDNLVTLCRRCHNRIEGYMKSNSWINT